MAISFLSDDYANFVLMLFIVRVADQLGGQLQESKEDGHVANRGKLWMPGTRHLLSTPPQLSPVSITALFLDGNIIGTCCVPEVTGSDLLLACGLCAYYTADGA